VWSTKPILVQVTEAIRSTGPEAHDESSSTRMHVYCPWMKRCRCHHIRLIDHSSGGPENYRIPIIWTVQYDPSM
jgi:hypothetical protein